MRAIVTGMIANYPVGGVAWDYGQYAVGLERLGFEVYYLEDTGLETYDPTLRQNNPDPAYGVAFLNKALTALSPSLEHRWHFRGANGKTFGISKERFNEVIKTSDLFLNVSNSALLRDEYMKCSCKVLIDTDPGWNHFVNYPKWDNNPGWEGSHGYRGHDYFFTYAERIGEPDCPLPDLGLKWIPTRPLVICDFWDNVSSGSKWTTIMSWNTYNPLVHPSVEYKGVRYGAKEMEFVHIESVPAGLPDVSFELATGTADAPRDKWSKEGWSVIDSHDISGTLEDYRTYIEKSRGEFSIAKNVYVATRSGWFSCRSVCYLAASRPVVIQDTGFSQKIPTGLGLLSFIDKEEAISAIEDVEAHYVAHQKAALEIARSYFASDVVLGDLLKRVGLI